MKRSFLLLFILTINILKAQPLVSIFSTDIIIEDGAEVYIGGDLVLSDGSDFVLQGNLSVDGSLTSEANYQQSGSLHTFGNLSLFGQNQLFGSASEVYLDGNDQIVEGEPIFIGSLFCSNTQIKTLKTDISVGQLFLDSSIINTEKNTLEIQSSSINSITYSSGWVRSDSSGMLSRNMNNGLTYDFPIGSISNRFLARITPSVDGITGVRYASNDANDDGLFRSQVEQNLCNLNPQAYLRLYNTSGLENTIELRFPDAYYTNFPVVCERRSDEFENWSLLSEDEPLEEAGTRVFNVVPTQNEASIILGRLRPDSPQIIGEQAACQGDNSFIYSADTLLSNLVWTIGGGQLVSQQNEQAEVNWGFLPSGIVSAVATDGFGCSSLPGNLSIVLHPLPEAIISVTPPPLPFEQEVYTLESVSNLANLQFWELEGVEVSSQPTVELKFDEPGDYMVVLNVISEEGCLDTAQVILTVEEGFLFSNVFSPNGDGINDQFVLPNSGLENFSLVIWSRWGNEVFRTTSDKTSWDGRDFSGNLVPPGTYFYELKAKSSSNDYSKKGSIQLLY